MGWIPLIPTPSISLSLKSLCGTLSKNLPECSIGFFPVTSPTKPECNPAEVTLDSVQRFLAIDKVCDAFESAVGQDPDLHAEQFFDSQRHTFGASFSEEQWEAIRDPTVVELILIEFDSKDITAEEIAEKYPAHMERFLARLDAGLTPTSEVIECPQCKNPNLLSADQTRLYQCKNCGHTLLTSHLDLTGTLIHRTSETQVESLIPHRFELRNKVGEGAFGIVFQAWDTKLDRFVAIKLPKWRITNRQLFLREAKAASQLRHPNVVKIFDVGENPDSVYIVSDFIEGTPLNRWIQQRDLSVDKTLKISKQICEGIQHAHENGVIHRDLKPGNIVVDESERPHILDFGLSKSLNWEVQDSIAKEGCPIGTPAYMSPEQVQGKTDSIDHRTDIYALGVILFQLLTGYLPFTGNSPEIFNAVLKKKPPDPKRFVPNLPASLSAIVMKCMKKNADERYQSATELVADLDAFEAGERVEAYPKLETRVVKQSVRKHYKIALIAGLLILAGVFGWGWNQANRELNPQVKVMMDTDPPEATLTWHLIDPMTGLRGDQVFESESGELIPLPPGRYLVTIEHGSEYFEVIRTVPEDVNSLAESPQGTWLNHLTWEYKDGIIILPAAKIIPHESLEDMVYVPGTLLETGSEMVLPHLQNHKIRLTNFLVARNESTLAEIQAVFPNYTELFVNGDIAIAYAEKMGASLPDVFEYLRIEQSAKGKVNGLYDGLAEWTSSPLYSSTLTIGSDTKNFPGDVTVLGMIQSTDRSPQKFGSLKEPTAVQYFSHDLPKASSGCRLIRHLEPRN